MSVLRWGLMSTARINAKVLPALRACPRAAAVAVASRSLEGARAYAEAHGLEQAFGSYEAMLADPDIDAVYVSLPNHLHAEWTIRAAEAGKHVLCEKPLALDVDDVDAIAAAAVANSVVVTEAFMYRHHPQTRRVLELIASGAIGEVCLVRGSFSFPLTNPGDVRLDPVMGGGSAWDVGVYPISYARTVIGRAPDAVSAHRHLGPTGIDLWCLGTLHFGDGVSAQFDSSFAAPYRTNLEIVGTRGLIVLDNPFKPGRRSVVRIGPAGDHLEEVIVEAGADLYDYEIADLTAAVLDGAPLGVDLADSRANTATVVAAHRSAVKGGIRTAVGETTP
ncbi:MAG: Gfo/Idh/MocA family protein [Acidimicrobiales bacterium]